MSCKECKMDERTLQKEKKQLRENCILECDSSSYPPETSEYIQCGCKYCRLALADLGLYLDENGKLIEPRTVGGSLD